MEFLLIGNFLFNNNYLFLNDELAIGVSLVIVYFFLWINLGKQVVYSFFSSFDGFYYIFYELLFFKRLLGLLSYLKNRNIFMVVRLGYLRSFIVENFLSFKNNVDLLLGDLKKNILERFRLCTLKLLQLLEMHRRLEYVLFQKNNINISKIVFFTNLWKVNLSTKINRYLC